MQGDWTSHKDSRRAKGRSCGWRKAGIVLAGVLVFATLWVAGPQTALAQDKSAAVLKAERILELTGAGELALQVSGPMMDQLAGIIIQVNPDDGQLIKYLLNKHFAPEFEARLPEFMELSARIYAEHFTEAELDELIAFYETPLGQKMIAKLPVLTQQSMELGGLWGQQVAIDALEKLVPVLKEYGLQEPRI